MAAKQILFMDKNKADISNSALTATASEGNDYALRPLNGSNILAWITTGSTDASLTTYTVNFGDPRRIDTLILGNHNFKEYYVEWFDGLVWTTIIDVSAYTSNTSFHSFTLVHAERLRLTIRKTQVTDSDKFLYQFIATEAFGRLNSWPIISNPKKDLNLQNTKMLSGKMQIVKNLGGWTYELNVQILSDSDDLALIQDLYSAPDGFLVALSGGDDTQFRVAIEPYRAQDVLLMRTVGTYAPLIYKGLYATGYTIKMQLAEVTE